MATRAHAPEIRALLVDLLNEFNYEVVAAHNSAEGKAILARAGENFTLPDDAQVASQPEQQESAMEPLAEAEGNPFVKHIGCMRKANDAT